MNRDLTSCPRPEWDGVDIHGREIGDGIYGIGSVQWSEERKTWVCLADAFNALAVVEVSIKERT